MKLHDLLNAKTTSHSLVGNGAVNESITDDPIAMVKCRSDGSGYVIGTGSSEQQSFVDDKSSAPIHDTEERDRGWNKGDVWHRSSALVAMLGKLCSSKTPGPSCSLPRRSVSYILNFKILLLKSLLSIEV